MSAEIRTDVAVIGLGAMGSMTLWRLAQRGVRALGVEQFVPGHDRGSSHGGSRIFRTAVFEGSEYVPIARLAHRLWKELEHAAGDDLLVTTGGLMFGSPESEVVTGSRAAAETHDIAHEAVDDTDELRARWPQIAFADGDVGILERGAGALRPERAIQAATGAAAKLGAEVLTSTPVHAVHADDSGVVVETPDATIRAARAVISVGAWSPQLFPALRQRLEVRRAVMSWYRGDPLTDYVPTRLPVFIRATIGLPAGWGIPDLDGRGFKLGDDIEDPRRTLEDPYANPTVVTDIDTAGAQQLCQSTFPGADPRPVHTQVCMTTHTPDNGFCIGTSPQTQRLVVLAGFSGHGFKYAAGIGEIAALLATEGGSPYDLEPFDPNRFEEARA